MLNQHVVLDHRDLRMVAAFAHNHEPVDMLAAGEEVLLHDLVLAAALTTVVAATLLFGLETGGAFDIGDFVDVLLLAGTADWLFAFLHALT